MTAYENRQDWDLDAWPEMYDALKQLQVLIFLAPPGPELNFSVFTVASLAAGCRHCQAHGGYGLHRVGVADDKIAALWDFETSSLFDDRERAALRLAFAGGVTPNAVTADHHADVRAHFSDEEARTLISVIALAGFMNRYNDTLATVTDAESTDWAATVLGPVGWEIGKHTGASHEQRAHAPGR